MLLIVWSSAGATATATKPNTTTNMKTEIKKAAAVQINYHFNWGCGGYNTVTACSMEEAMEKALESCDQAPEWGVINLEPDEDFKITRASDKAFQGMFD